MNFCATTKDTENNLLFHQTDILCRWPPAPPARGINIRQKGQSYFSLWIKIPLEKGWSPEKSFYMNDYFPLRSKLNFQGQVVLQFWWLLQSSRHSQVSQRVFHLGIRRWEDHYERIVVSTTILVRKIFSQYITYSSLFLLMPFWYEWPTGPSAVRSCLCLYLSYAYTLRVSVNPRKPAFCPQPW